MSQYAKYEWAVRALNPKNEKDKRSIANATKGFGYVILKQPEAGKQYYIVGFKHFGGPLSTGSQLATPEQSRLLEKIDGRHRWRASDHENK